MWYRFMAYFLRESALLIGCHPVAAQEAKPPEPRPAKQENGVKQPAQTTDSAQPEKPPEKKKKLVRRGGILVAPRPISSPAIGSGIVPVLAYIFPFSLKDEASPPSVLGVASLVTDNGSRGFAVGDNST
jgi:hypothetical protein